MIVDPKPNFNNKNTDSNIFGRIIAHEYYLNQGVQDTSSPTFSNLSITNDTTINGNLYVNGNASILDTNITEFEDNILLINSRELGPGVTLNQSGIEINRGSLENYRMIFNESDDTFKTGFISNLQTVALRNDAPITGGIFTWDNTTNLLNATNTISIPITFSSTIDSISTTIASVLFNGGINVEKKLRANDSFFIKSNELRADTVGNLNIILQNTSGNLSLNSGLTIPAAKMISFGNTSNSLSSDSAGNVLISASSNIVSNTNITVPVNKSINLGQGSIQTNNINDMTLTSARDIIISPTTGQKIIIPLDIPLAFGTVNQQIYGDITGDLNILANNNINVTPGANLNMRLPDNAGIKFGGTGSQRISSDSLNILSITSAERIKTSSIQIPNGFYLSVGNTMQNIYGDGTNTVFHSSNITSFTGTANSTSTSTGSVIFNGGIGVSGNIYSKNVTIDSSGSLLFPGSNLVYSLSRSSRRLTLDVPYNTSGSIPDFSINNSFNVNSFGQVYILNTEIGTSVTTGSIIANGSLGVMGINSGMPVNINTVSANALNIVGALSVNTVDNTTHFESTNVTFDGNITMNDNINLGGNRVINVAAPVDGGDVVTKQYLDLIKQGLFVKDSVIVASTQAYTLSDIIPGYIIDGYALEAGDRILLKNQVNAIDNGIYLISISGNPVRSTDMSTGITASGMFVFVESGTVNAALGWICNSVPGNDIVGTDELSFTQFTALGQVVAGDGLTKNFNTLNVNVDDTSIEIVSDALRIKSTIAGTGITGGSGSPLSTLSDQSHVTKLGIINQGTWNGNQITVPYGGTGVNNFTAASILVGNGTSPIETHSDFCFTNGNLGIGTNTPVANLNVSNSGGASFLLHADTVENSAVSYPSIQLKHGNSNTGTIELSRDYNQTAIGIYPDSLTIDNDLAIQLCTAQISRMIIASNGNIGINTTNPNTGLHVNDGALFSSTVDSLGLSSGSLVNLGGMGVGKNLNIGGITKISSTEETTGFSNGSLQVEGGVYIKKNLRVGGSFLVDGNIAYSGGISIEATVNSTSGQTGSINTLGGLGITKDLVVDGTVFVDDINMSGHSLAATNGNLILGSTSGTFDVYTPTRMLGGLIVDGVCTTDTLIYTNGVFQELNNNSAGNLWVYLGQVDNIHFKTITNTTEMIVSFDGTSVEYYNVGPESADLPFSFYDDAGDTHLFIKVPAFTVINLHVDSGGNGLQSTFEGNGASPNGNTSNFTGSWTIIPPSLSSLFVGDTTVDKLMSSSGLIDIGIDSVDTRDLGVNFIRYIGDITGDSPELIDSSIPDQSTLTTLQVKFSTQASLIDNYYSGQWIKTDIGMTRQIIDYNGAFRLATISEPWVINPSQGNSLSIYSKSNSSIYYSEQESGIVLAYTSIDGQDVVHTHGNINLICQNITCANIQANNATVSSLYSEGDSIINGKLNVNSGNIVFGDTAGSILINGTSPSIVFGGNTSLIDFGNYILKQTTGTLTLDGQSNSIFTINSSGNVGIGAIPVSLLTLKSGSFITTGVSNGSISITGNNHTGGAMITINQNNVSIDGNVLSLNDNIISTDNSVKIVSTNVSVNSSSGGLIIIGGVGINSTAGATSFTSGGALTVNGGGAFKENVYINGNLTLNGTLVNNNATDSPGITFSNTQNCNVNSFGNVNRVITNDQVMLSFNVVAIPEVSSSNTQFEFELPDVQTLDERGDVIIQCSGYSDDTLVIPLFNLIGVGIQSSTRALIKFQSNSTGMHWVQVICRYTM